MNHRQDYIDIAVAIIRNRDRVLVGKRPKGKAFFGRWEFPGGKTEECESPEDCIVREAREELGIEVAIVEPLMMWEYVFEKPKEKRFRLRGYLCKIMEGEPKPLEHTELRWVGVKDLIKLDLLESDREIIPLVREKLHP